MTPKGELFSQNTLMVNTKLAKSSVSALGASVASYPSIPLQGNMTNSPSVPGNGMDWFAGYRAPFIFPEYLTSRP